MDKTTTLSDKKVLLVQLLLLISSLTIPLFVSGPQLLTGSLVNSFLFLSTKYLTKNTKYLMITLPSIGAVLNGILFGKFTIFLVYLLPFIWISNLILINSFKKDNFINILTSAALKSLFLFTFTFLLFKLSIIPQVFLSAMGIFQFITAILGGFIYLGVNKLVKNY